MLTAPGADAKSARRWCASRRTARVADSVLRDRGAASSESDDSCAVRWSTDMTERDPALEPFDALIGTWATEATHPLVDAVVPGSVTFEWLEGGHFLVQRSHNDHELFPDAIGVIGAPETGDGLVMEYFDSRGVRRTYGISLDDGVLSGATTPDSTSAWPRSSGSGRVRGRLSACRDAGRLKDDLRVTYRPRH